MRRSKMKLRVQAFSLFMALIALGALGCSSSTKSDVNELGNDMKRDINKAARNVDDAVKDAVD